MKKNLLISTALLAVFVTSIETTNAQVLTGDTRLACEAVLCLSSGTRPGECSPSLSRYFGINKRKFSDTIKARVNFLNMCPMSSQPPEMQSLVSAISQGAGRCDATSLNSVLRSWSGLDDSYTYISNSLPDYCAVFMGNSYSGLNHNYIFPRYVGTQERGGYWVEARDYEQALADYNERIRREDEERRNASGWGN